VQHDLQHVGGFAQGGIANDIDISKTRDAERIAQARAARAFEIEQKLQILSDSEAGIERLDARGLVLLVRAQTVDAAVLAGNEGCCWRMKLAWMVSQKRSSCQSVSSDEAVSACAKRKAGERVRRGITAIFYGSGAARALSTTQRNGCRFVADP
jgi:hypothetical protein